MNALDDQAAAVVAALGARYGVEASALHEVGARWPFVEVAGAGPLRVYIVPACGHGAMPELHIGAHRPASDAAAVIAGAVLNALAGSGPPAGPG